MIKLIFSPLSYLPVLFLFSSELSTFGQDVVLYTDEPVTVTLAKTGTAPQSVQVPKEGKLIVAKTVYKKVILKKRGTNEKVEIASSGFVEAPDFLFSKDRRYLEIYDYQSLGTKIFDLKSPKKDWRTPINQIAFSAPVPPVGRWMPVPPCWNRWVDEETLFFHICEVDTSPDPNPSYLFNVVTGKLLTTSQAGLFVSAHTQRGSKAEINPRAFRGVIPDALVGR